MSNNLINLSVIISSRSTDTVNVPYNARCGGQISWAISRCRCVTVNCSWPHPSPYTPGDVWQWPITVLLEELATASSQSYSSVLKQLRARPLIQSLHHMWAVQETGCVILKLYQFPMINWGYLKRNELKPAASAPIAVGASHTFSYISWL